MRVEFSAGVNDEGRRLEAVVRRLLPHVSLARLFKALRSGDIRLNGVKAGPDARVRQGDRLSVWDHLVAQSPAVGPDRREPPPPLPADWVIFESADFVLVNKPSGVLVQGGPTGEDSLDDQVRSWLSSRLLAGLSFRPGPLHRLDRPTSGLVVFSASLAGAQSFSSALADGRVKKTYWALLQGRLLGSMTVDVPLLRQETQLRTTGSVAGKAARTSFEPLVTGPDWTWARVSLEHGRTHQIRAHASEVGFPLIGDTKYGARALDTGGPRPWYLHARELECDLFPRQTAPMDAPTRQYLQKTFKLSVEDADQF